MASFASVAASLACLTSRRRRFGLPLALLKLPRARRLVGATLAGGRCRAATARRGAPAPLFSRVSSAAPTYLRACRSSGSSPSSSSDSESSSCAAARAANSSADVFTVGWASEAPGGE